MLDLTDARGQPLCAAVRPPAITWSAVRADRGTSGFRADRGTSGFRADRGTSGFRADRGTSG
nr:DUF5990 family protein [Frankia sp. CpI1-P]